MKKNLISIIILALLIVNIALTAVMMFSVMGTSRKTAKLVDNIASALDLELAAAGAGEGEEEIEVPMSDTEVYTIAEMMIPLKVEEDGTQHYCLTTVSLSINKGKIKGDKGYKKFGSDLSAQENLIKSEINTVFGKYTLAEARDNQEMLQDEILEKVQEMFDSKFIFDVSFSDTMYQ